MQATYSASQTISRWRLLILPLSLFLLVVGSRCWALSYAGSPLPFFDQWVAEFHNTLLLPALNPDASPAEVLLWPHNEHRLLFTKIAVQATATLTGCYDTLFLGTLSALVYGALSVALFQLLAHNETCGRRALLWLACALFFAPPLSGYNTLCSLQLSFTLASIGLVIALRAAAHWPGDRRGPFAILAGSFFGLANLASGIAIPAATLLAGLASGAFHRRAFWLAWLASVFGVLLFVQSATAHGSLSISPSFPFLLELLAWPGSARVFGVLSLVIAFSVFGPLVWRLRGCVNKRLSFALGIFAFGLANVALIAVKRAPGEIHPRYWETVMLVPFALVCGLILSGETAPARVARLRPVILGVMFTGLTLGLAHRFVTISLPYYRELHTTRAATLEKYRSAILENGALGLETEATAAWAIKGPALFDDPVWQHHIPEGVSRGILLRPAAALGILTPSLFPDRPQSFASRAAEHFRNAGPWLVLAGLLGAAAHALASWRRPGMGEPRRVSRSQRTRRSSGSRT